MALQKSVLKMCTDFTVLQKNKNKNSVCSNQKRIRRKRSIKPLCGFSSKKRAAHDLSAHTTGLASSKFSPTIAGKCRDVASLGPLGATLRLLDWPIWQRLPSAEADFFRIMSLGLLPFRRVQQPCVSLRSRIRRLCEVQASCSVLPSWLVCLYTHTHTHTHTHDSRRACDRSHALTLLIKGRSLVICTG